MFKHLPKLAIAFSAVAAAEIASLAIAPSASAFSVNSDWVEFGLNDINQSFIVDFDGNVATQNVIGLSSQATFTFKGFTTVGTGTATKTEAKFDISLTNNSSDGITSRTSALGFNVYEAMYSDKLALVGVGNDGGSGNTRSTGLFAKDNSGSFPNQFGAIDVCFTDGNTCQGGSNGGVDNNSATSQAQTGTFTATLAVNGNIDKIALANFGVRYQSISGKGLNGASGTGRGDINYGPRKIPEPTTTAALGLVALSGLALRKRNKAVPQT
ncbi:MULTISPECIES: cistern family PEP-CTERM protein [Oscillatoriales]|uniref:Cistern family PEP-CTERM protein n=1 Tax=Aerosakkonema funiforme FACHB-1375 TaxID=2949571 RepID=A0A926VNA8_9CYAN|nr:MULTISPECIES: cistern family PEP-CTERM protein [Oscillatoriales]MBD2185982.1 cistern family PEP-CTERM protein [Aerosakkonema funiforme FACHB-1375]